ncbi:LacI family transcriptional regulator [Aureimonas endophytica]|uniref:LacI family transcriptional regulator n=1 Tax=Aureimonas endophytica TaxID=2027858 RepID=A0A916ZFP9_9HYPH|nr:LacI family DNA-binding transcriptional regulator [Aureimonas endophytica]GGD94835.1 LacI family transcriptional regulator [Aureimonas endophytica]
MTLSPPSGRGLKPATIRDVARLAGVAPGTVSNVLTGRKLVAEPLRKAVLAAVAELDYRPNHLASSLRFGRTQSIGIVVPDLTNPFFSSFVQEIESLAAADRFQILLMSSQEDPEGEVDRIKALLARQVDGLIIAASRDDVAYGENSTFGGTPAVLVDRAFGAESFDTVATDNEAACRTGTAHLLELGHRDIAFLATDERLTNIKQRTAGYRQALADAGLPGRERIVYGGLTIETCRAAIEQELRRADRPTAIFASAYVATLGAAKAIRATDLAFPDDVSLLGFDDSDWMTVLRPYVSTIQQPIDHLANTAWRLLMRRIEQPTAAPLHEIVPCSLRPRESIRRLA